MIVVVVAVVVAVVAVVLRRIIEIKPTFSVC